MKKIFISSNCITGGLASFFQLIFNNYEVIPFPTSWFKDNKKLSIFKDSLKKTELWITNYEKKITEQYDVNTFHIPNIVFRAFHPDLINAQKIDGSYLSPVQSKIAIWSFINQVEAKQAAKLFNKNSFEELGYYDEWTMSRIKLESQFLNSDLSEEDFMKFYLSVKRTGIFMHSHNHPKIETIIQLGKIIAEKLNISKLPYDREIRLHDGLQHFICPVYPEIANELSLEGSYIWRIEEGKEIHGVLPYLNYLYEYYEKNKITHRCIKLQEDSEMLNKILTQLVN